MKQRLTVTILALALAGTLDTGCGGTRKEEPNKLVARGSTFVAPLMVQWSYWFERSDDGCRIDYSPFGSGSGIKAILEKKGDFACTDAPLTDAQLTQIRAAGGDVLHIPLVLGAVVPAYNLKELSETLRFSGPVLADIYLGKIRRWNDKALRDLNPQVAGQLPDKEIHVAHRKDGSGTTYIWVDYLSKVSPDWKQKLDGGTEVRWPTGTGAEWNEGVAKYVKETPGSIGYVELVYTFRRGLKYGLVQNRENEFVLAGLDSVQEAATHGLKNVSDDLRFSLTDPPGKGSYPICGATWAVAYINQPTDKGRLLANFLYWALDKGQEEAEALLYLRLPEPLRKRAEEHVARLIQAGR